MTVRLACHAALLLATACSGCSGRRVPTNVYAHIADQIRAASGLTGIIFDYPCTYEIGDVIARKPDSECYRLSPPQRLRGIWVNQFEGSEFFAGATAEPSAGTRGVWLEFEHPERQIRGWKLGERSAVVELELVGRPTMVRGRYGHMGGWPEEIVADRVLSARIIR